MPARNSTRTVRPHKMAMPPGPDNFEFDMLSDFKGYNSADDPTNTDPGFLVQGSQNVYKKISGTVGVRFGRKLWDSTPVDNTATGIKAGIVWSTSLGVTFPVRVVNGNFQFSSTILNGTQAWYTLQSSVTATRYVFDTYWDSTDKKDKLVFVRGDANTFDWAGGVGLFVSAINNTSITLDRATATAGFASTGSITINGTSYAYTGLSGNTLTGVTGDASGQAVNSVCFSAVKSQTGPGGSSYNHDFCRVIGNQFYVGSYGDRRVFISNNSVYTTFSQSSPRLPGEGATVTMDDAGKGIGLRQGTAHLFGSISSVYVVSFSQITVGSTLSEQVIVNKIQLGHLISALGHEFIDTLGDLIVYLDQSNQLRAFGNFRNLFTAKSTMLSQAVQIELRQADFTGGQLKVVSDKQGDIIYITAPNSGKVYWYQERGGIDPQGNILTERLWQPPFIWNVSRIDVIAGATVGFSNSNPQIYTLWDTEQWHDDSPSGQLPYVCTALWAYQNGGRRQGKIVFDKLYTEGYAGNGSEMFGGVYYDYQGSAGILNPIINSTDSPFGTGANGQNNIFTGSIPPSLGDLPLGDAPLGDGLQVNDDQALLPKFRTINGMQEIDCFEFAPMIYSQKADARWEVIAIGANIRESQSAAVEIMK